MIKTCVHVSAIVLQDFCETLILDRLLERRNWYCGRPEPLKTALKCASYREVRCQTSSFGAPGRHGEVKAHDSAHA